MDTNLIFLFILIVPGFTLAQSEIPSKLIPVTLPPEVFFQIEKDEALRNPNLTELARKCVENGGKHAYDVAQNATTSIGQCLAAVADSTSLNQEIEQAKLNGNVTKVFAKYCQAEPKLKFAKCFTEMVNSLKPCYPTEQVEPFETLHKVIDRFTNVICNKYGEDLDLLIAEGGQECWRERQAGLDRCAIDNVGIALNFDTDNLVGNLSKLTFNETNCKKINDLQMCVRTELQQCKGQTSKIVDTIFMAVRSSTPCMPTKVVPKSQEPNSATLLTVTVLTITMSAVALIL